MTAEFTLFAFASMSLERADELAAHVAHRASANGAEPADARTYEILALEPTEAPLVNHRKHHDLHGLAQSPPDIAIRVPLGGAVELGEAPAGVVAWCVAHSVVATGSAEAGPVGRFGLTIRHPGVGIDEFASHWRDRHVPLVLRSGPRFATYTTHVVQSGAVPWSGIAEQTFASRAAAAAHDHHNRVEVPEVAADARAIVAAAEQYWYRSP